MFYIFIFDHFYLVSFFKSLGTVAAVTSHIIKVSVLFNPVMESPPPSFRNSINPSKLSTFKILLSYLNFTTVTVFSRKGILYSLWAPQSHLTESARIGGVFDHMSATQLLVLITAFDDLCQNSPTGY